MSLVGFKGEDVNVRTKLVEEFFKNHFPSLSSRIDVEHVYKGKYHERKPNAISLVVFPSKTLRDEALKTIGAKGLILQEGGNPIRFGYAKTKKQLFRNFAVNQASELIKKDVAAKDKTVEIEWKHAEKGKRTILVNGQLAFSQSKVDVCGQFLAPFAHLTIE